MQLIVLAWNIYKVTFRKRKDPGRNSTARSAQRKIFFRKLSTQFISQTVFLLCVTVPDT